MSKSRRVRSRFYPLSLSEYFKAAQEGARIGSFSSPGRNQHFAQHSARSFIYTSPATLTTGTGTTLYPTFSAAIIGMRVSVSAAGSSLLTCDLFVNGVSVFGDSTDVKPTIAIGELVGYKQVMSKAHFTTDDYLNISLTATGGCTGPMVATLDYFNES